MAETSTAISAEGRVRSMMNWKETKCGKCKIQRARPVCNSCFSYDKFIPIAITNADRIRSMSDEELAEWLTSITDDAQSDAMTKCNYQWSEWLQSDFYSHASCEA